MPTLAFFLTFFLLGNGLSGISQTMKTCLVSGTLSKEAKGKVYLSFPDSSGKWNTDSCALNNGAFRFKTGIYHPTFARLNYGKDSKEFFLTPHSIKIVSNSSSLVSAKITGSLVNIEHTQLEDALQKIKNRWKNVMDTLKAINRKSNTAYQELKSWVLTPYFTEIKDEMYSFYDTHPSSFVTAYYLQIDGRDMTTDSLKLFYNRFPAVVRNSIYGKNIALEIEKRKVGIPGSIASSFTTIDINGSRISLQDFRGNYVLLDFWGSWCVPCRKGNPHLKELYSRYKGRGFEIIGVAADDDTPEKWLQAVREDGLLWKQILKGKTEESDISKKYNVLFYPTKILIDREGMIIGRFGEDSAALDQLLESLLK